MLDTKQFGNKLKEYGFNFFTGVPCSFLKHIINYAINDCNYIMAANEGDAVATAAGVALGGQKAVVLMQNSGLTNATSPLTSLTNTFGLPVLGFVSLRGEPILGDEPQHELMGVITKEMLDTIQVEWEILSAEPDIAFKQIEKANEKILARKSFFFVVRKNTFSYVKLENQKLLERKNITKKTKNKNDEKPNRIAALEIINKQKDKNTAVLATTGKTGRELYETEDAPNNLYMVGSLGCISPLALGLAIARPDKKVIAIDGDASALMRLGSLATNAYYQPSNMLHVLLDNNTHDSTGGQATISHIVDFVDATAAMAYPSVIHAHNTKEFEEEIAVWKKKPKLTLIYLRIAKGSKNPLGRPKIKPIDVTTRLQNFLAE